MTYLLDDKSACELCNHVGRTVLGWYIEEVRVTQSCGSNYNEVTVKATAFQAGFCAYDEMINTILRFKYNEN